MKSNKLFLALYSLVNSNDTFNLGSDKMLRIKEFAALCKCSVYTLRYYDEMGLLKPKIVDEKSNYRYYTQDQLKDYQLIKILQDAGFKLTDILNIHEMEEEKILEVINEKITDLHKQIEVLNQLKIKLKEK